MKNLMLVLAAIVLIFGHHHVFALGSGSDNEIEAKEEINEASFGSEETAILDVVEENTEEIQSIGLCKKPMGPEGTTYQLPEKIMVTSGSGQFEARTNLSSDSYIYLKNQAGETVGELHANPNNYGKATDQSIKLRDGYHFPIEVASYTLYSWWNRAYLNALTLNTKNISSFYQSDCKPMNNNGLQVELPQTLLVTKGYAKFKADSESISDAWVYLKNKEGKTVGELHANPNNFETLSDNDIKLHEGYSFPIEVAGYHIYSWWNDAQLTELSLISDKDRIKHNYEQLGLVFSDSENIEGKTCVESNDDLPGDYVCWYDHVTDADGSDFSVSVTLTSSDDHSSNNCDYFSEDTWLCYERDVLIKNSRRQLDEGCGGFAKTPCEIKNINYVCYNSGFCGLEPSFQKTCDLGLEIVEGVCWVDPIRVDNYRGCTSEELGRVRRVLNDTARDIFEYINLDTLQGTVAYRQAFQVDQLNEEEQKRTFHHVKWVLEEIKKKIKLRSSTPRIQREIYVDHCRDGSSGVATYSDNTKRLIAGAHLSKKYAERTFEFKDTEPDLYADYHSRRGVAIHELSHLWGNTVDKPGDGPNATPLYFTEQSRNRYIKKRNARKLDNIADAYRVFYEILMNGDKVKKGEYEGNEL